MSSGWHVDGVGEALVFTLKTSLRLKTGGLVYRPVPGALTKSRSKSKCWRGLGEETLGGSVIRKRHRLGEGVAQPGRRQIKHYQSKAITVWFPDTHG